MVEMTNFEQAVDQVITDSERLHKVVNGTSVETIVVEDGSVIPSLRKAIMDNLYFKTPAMPWIPGTVATVFNQLYSFHSAVGVQWWYAPSATASAPVALPVDPTSNVNWRLYLDGATMAKMYAPLDSPVLIGNPQAPTPIKASNTTTIATTAFVKTAIADALTGFTGGPITVPAITVTGTAALTTLAVGGASVFTGPVTMNGPLTADNTAARFESITLTKELSSIGFSYTDPLNPSNRRTRVTPYQVQTHQMDVDRLLSGVAVADDTTMSTRCIGNSLFDYVYIRGNSNKPITTPRLVVDGVTRLQNLEITGSLSGVSFSVDGQVTKPLSIETTQGIIVGTDLVVNGNSDLGAAKADSLIVSGTTTLNGLATMNGGFDTGVASGRVGGTFRSVGAVTFDQTLNVTGAVGLASTLSVDGLLSALAGMTVSGNLNTTGNISATGNVTLNTDGVSTTKVHNLEISGTVSGLIIDLSGQNVNVASLSSFGNGSISGNLTVSGDTSVNKLTTSFVEHVSEDVGSSTAAWSPSGISNIYNVTVDAALTINMWPGIDQTDKPAPFHAVIYLWQDAVGHAVTFNGSYLALNAETVNPAPNSVTIVNLSYCGRGTVVDMVIARRP